LDKQSGGSPPGQFKNKKGEIKMEFNKNKMEKFMKEDLLISRMVNNAVNNGINYNEALKITFNSEVIGDKEMSTVYEAL